MEVLESTTLKLFKLGRQVGASYVTVCCAEVRFVAFRHDMAGMVRCGKLSFGAFRCGQAGQACLGLVVWGKLCLGSVGHGRRVVVR
jgi:hypothetical protein